MLKFLIMAIEGVNVGRRMHVKLIGYGVREVTP
jgi:hypothetical protein